MPVSVDSASCKSKFTSRHETRSGFLIPEKKALLLWTRRRNNSYPSSTNHGALSDLMRGINKYTFCTRASLCTWTSCLTDIKAFSPDSFVKSLNLSTELYNYHDNHSQQRPDAAGYSKLRTRYSPVKASTEHRCLLKGLCQNSPLPTPLVLAPKPHPPTHC